MRPLFLNSKMNKTEAKYADLLEMRKKAGNIIDYYFEPMGLKLAGNTFYHPDFLVVFPDHFELHECKGFWRDDAKVKIKVAADKFKWFKFIVVKYVKGNWEFEDV